MNAPRPLPRLADRRASDAQALASASTARDVWCAVTGAADEAAPLVLIPVNERPLVPLPIGTQAAFQAHLERTVLAAWAMPVSEAAVDGDEAPPSSAEDLACGVCAGACCPAGGTTAFLSVERLVAIRQQLLRHGRAVEADELQEEYVAYLPDRHYEASCVYHGARGCTLPRVLRSSLCNRYRCGGLTQLTRAITTDPRHTVFVAAAGAEGLRRVARIDADGAVPVSPPA